MNIRIAVLILLSLFIAPAMANKPQLPATPITTSQPAEIIFMQQELAVDVPDSSAATAQYGLLGAIIGSAITNAQVKNGEQRVAELRNLLLDYPFNARMEQSLRAKLAENGILGEQGLRVLHTTWDADPQSAAANGDAIVLTPRYSILNNFELLSVKLTFNHVERTARPGKKPRQKIRLSRTYAFDFPLEKISGSGAEEDAARWVSFGRAPLEHMLDLGIDQVTDMLVYDLSTEGREEAALQTRGSSVVREGGRWNWLRNRGGALAARYPVNEAHVATLTLTPVPMEALASDAGAGSAAGQEESDTPLPDAAAIDVPASQDTPSDEEPAAENGPSGDIAADPHR